MKARKRKPRPAPGMMSLRRQLLALADECQQNAAELRGLLADISRPAQNHSQKAR
jgi:hypothetical protein